MSSNADRNRGSDDVTGNDAWDQASTSGLQHLDCSAGFHGTGRMNRAVLFMDRPAGVEVTQTV
jgi:hypothetical protein